MNEGLTSLKQNEGE